MEGEKRFCKKKKDETRFRRTKSFPLFPSPPLPLFPADAFDSIAFDLPFDPSIPSSIDAQKARKPGRIRLDSWKTRFLPSRTARYLFLPVPVPGDNGREKLNFALALPSSSPRG